MSGVLYEPDDGLLILADAHYRALVTHGAGRRPDRVPLRELEKAGVLVDGRPDRPIAPIVRALCGTGPRLRLLSRRRGSLTVTDVAVPAPGAGGPAALALRPRGSTAVHLHHLTPGTAARRIARRTGVGAHLAVEPVGLPAADLAWPTIRQAFDTPTPSGWAGGHQRVELHELRWAPARGQAARTALALATLDGVLVEITPSSGDHYRLALADARSLWLRLCLLTTGTLGACPPPGAEEPALDRPAATPTPTA